MQTVFPWLVILAVGATLAVLAVGILAMLRQGRFNARHSNTLMRYRLVFQFAAIALITLAYLFGHR
jgi:hypothetical protein